MDETLTTPDVVKRFGCHKSTAEKWAVKNRLDFIAITTNTYGEHKLLNNSPHGKSRAVDGSKTLKKPNNHASHPSLLVSILYYLSRSFSGFK